MYYWQTQNILEAFQDTSRVNLMQDREFHFPWGQQIFLHKNACGLECASLEKMFEAIPLPTKAQKMCWTSVKNPKLYSIASVQETKILFLLTSSHLKREYIFSSHTDGQFPIIQIVTVNNQNTRNIKSLRNASSAAYLFQSMHGRTSKSDMRQTSPSIVILWKLTDIPHKWQPCIKKPQLHSLIILFYF
jgi:hypothetical protein